MTAPTIKRTVTYTGEESLWTPEQFLEMVIADRSSGWTDYNLEDLSNYPEEIIEEWMNNDYEEWEIIK